MSAYNLKDAKTSSNYCKKSDIFICFNNIY